MKAELRCADVRTELSAKIDGELGAEELARVETHLSSCADCRSHEASLRAARRIVRLQPAGSIPDLTDSIMDAVEVEHARSRERRVFRAQLRTGAVAAVAAALLFIGVTTPFREGPADVAGASEIVRKVKDAARALTSFRATFQITERNWHPAVGVRIFEAEVWFEAPERFRLQLRDLTAYPDPKRWPGNNVDLVANPHSWWIREPFSCPVEALPDCAVSAEQEQRSIVNRGPFDGTAVLPTDIVVPVETISGGEIAVLGDQTIAGHATHRLELTYRQALPLIGALQPGGSWRPFHPLDKVELWIDRNSSIPVRYRVIAGSGDERARWAETNLVADHPGQVLLDVKATSISARSSPESRFDVPKTGMRTDAGWRHVPFPSLAAGRAPSDTAGLEPYRAGRGPSGAVLSYADGLTWLNVIYRPNRRSTAEPSLAEEVRLKNGFGYYLPADEDFRRSLDVFGPKQQVRLESNLPRSRLLSVAGSLPLEGRKVVLPGPRARIGPAELDRVSWVLQPTVLPPGYDEDAPTAAIRYRSHGGRSVVLYYRNREAEFDRVGIRITQQPWGRLPPSSENFLTPQVDGARARWSAERSELEWIDGGVYRAVHAPSFDLATVLEVARGLR